MTELSDIRALYEAYIDEVRTLERNRKPGEGIFGLKGGPADNPCHDRFADELEKLLSGFSRDDPQTVRELLAYMYSIPRQHREPRSAYWMLLAVQSLSRPLIPALTPADAGTLRAQFVRDYPRWDRLPVHQTILDALKVREKQ